MNGITKGKGHSSPSDYDRNLYKIIFTKADMRITQEVRVEDIISNVSKREPIVEVWVNVAEHKVTNILEMPEQIMYDNIPVAIY